MSADLEHGRSRQLFALALLAALLATVWAWRTPVAPNSDRYDYLGRAAHVLEGEGPRPLVIYPLRLAFDGAASLPPENLTRPPLWPTLTAAPLGLGTQDAAGVAVGAIALFTLLPLVYLAGDRSFGPGAGGLAAFALAGAFATARALWGGGPELLIALLLFVAWTWNATHAGRWGWLGLGVILGTMPWLHPIGWLYAGLGLASRVGRTAPRGLLVAGAAALVLGLPWYVGVGAVTGQPLAPLQGSAELAKAVLDPGGLGAYRTLTPIPTAEILRDHTAAWLHQAAWNLKEQALHLDAWLAWPLVVLALLGTARDRTLALRDACLGLVAFVVVSQVARDPRLLVPLLPVACTWSGAGFRQLACWRPRWTGPVLATLLVGLPWVLPLGATLRPGAELEGVPDAVLRPDLEVMRAVAAAGESDAPLVVDSAVLAWRARRPAVFLPETPDLLEAVLARPAMAGAEFAVLQRGADSPWLAAEPSAWAEWLRERGIEGPTGEPLVVPLRRELPEFPDGVYTPAPMALTAADRPDSLRSIPVPPASREGLQLHPAALRALMALTSAAARDGVHLRVISAYRSYERQQQLHTRAIQRHGPDQAWVAAPGTSEHQLGTTVDFADAAMRHALEPEFEQTAEGRWLAAHALRFGFVRSYTEENAGLTGYEPEPWHFRHRPELAAAMAKTPPR